MARDMFKTAVAQMASKAGDVRANLDTIESLVNEASGRGAAFVVLPELATTGSVGDDRISVLAEPIPGDTSSALCEIAKTNSLYLACGIIERAGSAYHNTAVLCGPGGSLVATYRKAHFFSSEKSMFSAGQGLCVVDTDLGKIGLTICYDLVFPEYIRALVLSGAELIANCTNWVTNEYQSTEWGWSGDQVQALARTRTLKNGIYVAMADRIGAASGWQSLGHSCIAGPSGRLLVQMREEAGVVDAEVNLTPEYLAGWRSIATYLPDRRPEIYEGITTRPA